MARARPLPDVEGRLAENILHFTRALRKGGVKTGPAQMLTAVNSVKLAGFSKRSDFYYILRATLVNRAEDLILFDQCFAMFWRDPDYLEAMIHLLSPTMKRDEAAAKTKQSAERRAAQALSDAPEPPQDARERQELEVDAKFSWSANESLRRKDFEQMSLEELAQAEAALRAMRLDVSAIPTRRHSPAARGAIDRAATVRGVMRKGDLLDLKFKAPKSRPPDLVALIDISGSMAAYSRVLMQFLHALAHARSRPFGRVHGFTLGTRLTNVTRALARPDPDVALQAIGREAQDWQGGTRLGASLQVFNRSWSRRVLGSGAVVLLVSDGLERGDAAELAQASERLKRMAREVIWLNPLLRYAEFAPKAAGIRALLPNVDRHVPCHSLNSLQDLAHALSGRGAF